MYGNHSAFACEKSDDPTGTIERSMVFIIFNGSFFHSTWVKFTLLLFLVWHCYRPNCTEHNFMLLHISMAAAAAAICIQINSGIRRSMCLLSVDCDDSDRRHLLNKSKCTLFTYQLACRFRMKWNAKKAERKKHTNCLRCRQCPWWHDNTLDYNALMCN